MQCVDVRQPVEMIALFSGAQVRPLRFRWKGAVYKVRKVLGHWSSDSGMQQQVYFSVRTDLAADCELCFNSRDMHWMITRIAAET